MAIITLERNNNNILGKLKTYSLDNKQEYVLGIKLEDKIIKQNVLLENNKYNFIITNFNLSNHISCVIMKLNNDRYTPLIWGSTDETSDKNMIVFHLNESIEKIKTNEYNKSKILISEKHPAQSLNKISQHTNNTKHTNIDNEISPFLKEVALGTSQAQLFESSDNEIEKTIEREIKRDAKNNFYNMIAEQLDELFNTYPSEKNLENLIPNSKWVKINSTDNKYYVVGIIYEDNAIRYICYGVPGKYDIEPPIEMREYSQWLPTDTINPYENGYWVMYQDADSGENISIKF